jgi:hypothetical protein
MGVAFLVAAAFRWLTLEQFPNDHFDHVALAQQLRLGALPVRDFTDEGFPLTYAVSAAAWELLKTPFLAEAIVVVLGFAFAAAISFGAAARASGSLTAAAIAVAAQIALYPRTYSYPKLLVQAVAVAVAWWAVERLTSRRVAALAAATALGYYFRHDHAVYLGLAAVAMLIAANWHIGLSAIWRSMALYAGVVGAFVLPHLAYVQWAAGIPTYFAISREYARAEAVGGPYRLPVPYLDVQAGLWLRPESPTVNVRWVAGIDDRSRTSLERQYQMEVVEHDEGATWRYRIRDTSPANLRALRVDPRVDDTHGFERLESAGNALDSLTSIRPGPGWRVRDNSLAALFWLCWILPLLAFAILRIGRRQIPRSEAAGVVMLAVLALGANFGFLRPPLDVRLPDVAVPHTVLTAWIAAVVWRWRAPRRPRLLNRGVVVIATAKALTAIALFSHTGQLLQASGLFNGVDGTMKQWRSVTTHLRDNTPGPVQHNPSGLLLPFFEYLRACTDRDDRLLYAWYSPDVYVVADRGFAGDHRKFLAPFHAAPWEQARTIARLRQQSVPFVIVPAARRRAFETGYPEVWTYLKNRYVPMARLLPDDPAGFEILRESSWTSDRVYGTTTWPCVGRRP